MRITKSSILASTDEGWWYFTTHGVQPGSVPRDVEILEIQDKPQGSYVKLNRVLTTKELNYYDMKEKAPDSVMCASLKNYGGAFDVDPYSFFTKDDIVDFGYQVCEKIKEMITVSNFNPDLSDAYLKDDYKTLVIEVTIDFEGDDYEVSSEQMIDMRKIRKPNDLSKYAEKYARDIVDQFESELGGMY